MEKNELGFSIGIFDILTKKIREEIRREAESFSCYALGVYSNAFIEEELKTACLKSLEDRMKIAEQLDGVDFVFEVTEKDPTKVKESINKAYAEYLEREKEEHEKKKYKVGLTIGTFDLFHVGHLENILLAASECETLAAVVKTDERVQKRKHKVPAQSTKERAMVISMLKPVDHVFFMDLNSTRASVIEEVAQYYGVERSDMALFFGSDLIEHQKGHEDELAGVNVVFTHRDKEVMKSRSSSHYREELKRKNISIDEPEEDRDEV